MYVTSQTDSVHKLLEVLGVTNKDVKEVHLHIVACEVLTMDVVQYVNLEENQLTELKHYKLVEVNNKSLKNQKS